MEREAFAGVEHHRLPNGMEVACQSRAEIAHFYEDIFEKEVYLRGGITLPQEPVVLDVGANVGMFTLFVGRRRPGARVYAFEPAPPLFALLSANARHHAPRARLFQRGVAAAPGTAELTFYPGSSGMSSFHADRDEEREALRVLVLNEARRGVEGAKALLPHLEEYLEERLRSLTYTCPLTTLSRVLEEEGLERVDLLKIDVQKSELEVLAGLEEEHWPRVDQIAMEVHDLDGRVGEARDLLSGRGFAVTVEQDELYAGGEVYNLYAVARGRATRRRLPPRSWQPLVLSAPDAAALEEATDALAGHLAVEDGAAEEGTDELVDVAHACAARPAAGPHRRLLLARDRGDAASALAARDPRRLLEAVLEAGAGEGGVAFLFPGLGDHYPGMAAQLCRTEPLLEAEIERCCRLLEPHLGVDLRSLLHPPEEASGQEEDLDLRRMLGRGGAPRASETALRRTRFAQPALFVVEYALARLWMSWGVTPRAMVGYSLGEYTAACLAGVMELEDALAAVARRALLIDALPAGAMLAVPLAPEEVEPLLGEELAVAAVNGPRATVVGGPPPSVEELERRLAAREVVCRRLPTTHAFHTPMMEPAAGPLGELMAGLELRPPRLPYLSNVTGTWITAAEAVEGEYWSRHLTRPVAFGASLEELWRSPRAAFLEVGPGLSLGALAQQHPAARAGRPILPSLRHAYDRRPDVQVVLTSLGRLWLAGTEVDWRAAFGREAPRAASLPPLPEAAGTAPAAPRAPAPSGGGRGAARRPRPAIGTPYTAPAGDLQLELARLWCEVLELEEAGAHDSFFDLGGDSLRAARLLARLRRRYGVELSLGALFAAPTVASLAEELGRRR